ncbi:hypothetical protein ACFQ4Q_01190 [Lysobacter gummosus]|uniref:hypothetical protein n=1 Tax=Lysobacter gummosus TaxID=262324 RepID=UPI003631B789
MKQSPLQLKWVSYPSASYDVIDDAEGDGSSGVYCEVEAEVRYAADGEHFAMVRIKNRADDARSVYRFSITAFASFSFDSKVARAAYKTPNAQSLVPLVAVNLCRIIFSGAREYLAMITSRAPHGAAVLESVLLEPSDVRIRPIDMTPSQLIAKHFDASPEEVAQLEQAYKEFRDQNAKSLAKPGKKKVAKQRST